MPAKFSIPYTQYSRSRLRIGLFTLLLWWCASWFMPTAVASDNSPLVAAASSLRSLWPSLSTKFSQDTGLSEPSVSFGSSGLLSSQILHGAPFEVFLSADERTIERLLGANKALHPAVPFALGEIRLVTLANSEQGASLAEAGLPGLAIAKHHSGFRLAIANPSHAPYGIAAQQALTHAGLWPLPARQLLAAENAAQTLQFLRTGAVTAAIVPLALVIHQSDGLHISELPAGSYLPVQHIAVHTGIDSANAAVFIEWLQSDNATKLLAEFGLQPVN